MKIRKIKDIDAVPADKLSKHPDAKIPMDKEDGGVIERAILRNGIYVPLIVVADKTPEHYLIIDGCNRFDKGIEAKVTAFDCNLVECDDVRFFALENLSARRKCTAGQRIMGFLETHKQEVLKAVNQRDQIRRENLKNPNVSPKCGSSHFGEFTAKEIAAVLGCDEHDVGTLIDLLVCLEKKQTLPDPDTDKVKPAREKYLALLADEHRQIYEGSGEWRKWKASLASRASTKPVGKTHIDYGGLGCRSMISILTVFKNWEHVDLDHQKIVLEQFQEILTILPAPLKKFVRMVK